MEWPYREYKQAWSQENNKCISCKTVERKHQAKGLCTSCYRKQWKKTEIGKRSIKSDKYKQVRKKYNRFLISLNGRGKWSRLNKLGKLAKFKINNQIITVPMTNEDMDYWDSEYEFKEMKNYLKRRYGNGKEFKRING